MSRRKNGCVQLQWADLDEGSKMPASPVAVVVLEIVVGGSRSEEDKRRGTGRELRARWGYDMPISPSRRYDVGEQ